MYVRIKINNMKFINVGACMGAGIKKVFLGVHRENEGAMRLYEKVGFKKVDAPNLTSSHPLLMCFEDST